MVNSLYQWHYHQKEIAFAENISTSNAAIKNYSVTGNPLHIVMIGSRSHECHMTIDRSALCSI